MQTIPISKARVNLGDVVRRVHVDKESFILEKDGIPVAVLIDTDLLDDVEDYLELQDETIKADIAKSNAEFERGEGRPVQEFMAELEEEISKEQSAKQ